MKRIGLIGGLGPEATKLYYDGIIRYCKPYCGDELSNPEMVIYSANISILFGFLRDSDSSSAVEWFLGILRRLQRAGADFAAIGANTPHVYYADIEKESPLPMISIVQQTLRKAERMGLKKVGLMGTRFTMGEGFYQEVASDLGITVIVPNEKDRDYVDNALMTELRHGEVIDGTRRELLEIVSGMIEKSGIDGLILGCTELPMILRGPYKGIPFLDTTDIHCRAIAAYATEENS